MIISKTFFLAMAVNLQTDLEPIDTTAAGLIVAGFALEHLDHEALTSILDTLLQEGLDFFDSIAVASLREAELSGDLLEVFLEQSPTL